MKESSTNTLQAAWSLECEKVIALRVLLVTCNCKSWSSIKRCSRRITGWIFSIRYVVFLDVQLEVLAQFKIFCWSGIH